MIASARSEYDMKISCHGHLKLTMDVPDSEARACMKNPKVSCASCECGLSGKSTYGVAGDSKTDDGLTRGPDVNRCAKVGEGGFCVVDRAGSYCDGSGGTSRAGGSGIDVFVACCDLHVSRQKTARRPLL